jgi:ABC-2 type transport system permease protein
MPSLNSSRNPRRAMGNSQRILFALLKKEFYQIFRDPSSLLIAFIFPVILVFLYGNGVSLDLTHLRIGLVMEDTAPDAQSLAQSFTDSRYFNVKVVRDRRELEDDIARGWIRGFVVIPSYFSEFRSRPNQIAPIQVIADGSETNTANFVQNYTKQTVTNWLHQEEISSSSKRLPKIEIQPRFWYNEKIDSRYFVLSGSLATILTLIGTLLTALVISREWERGTMESMIATPVGIWELILAKLIPYFILGFISLGICVFLSVYVYGIPFEGSLFALVLVSSVFLFTSMSIGLMISTLTKEQMFSYQIAILSSYLPAYILSGFLFEIYSMPYWLQLITYIVPARYYVQSLQTIFLVGDVWPIFLKNMAAMLIIGLFFFLITMHKTVKRLD